MDDNTIADAVRPPPDPFLEAAYASVGLAYDPVTSRGIRDDLIAKFLAQGLPPMEACRMADELNDKVTRTFINPQDGPVIAEPVKVKAKARSKARAKDKELPEYHEGEPQKLNRRMNAVLQPEWCHIIIGLPEEEKNVLIALLYFRNKETETAFPGLAWLMALTGYKENKVRLLLRKLQDRKIIRRKGGGYRETATEWYVWRSPPAK